MSIRIYVTGSCDGLETLRDALNEHPDLELGQKHRERGLRQRARGQNDSGGGGMLHRGLSRSRGTEILD